MDIDAILAEFRTLVTAWQAARSRGSWTERDADRTIELAAELDRVLSSGGRLPDAWRQAR